MSREKPSATPPPPGSDHELRDELARLLGADAPPPELGSLYAGLQAEIARERGARAWLRSRSTPARAAIAGAGLLLGTLGLGLLWPRPDAELYPAARMATIVLFSAGLITGQLWLVLRPLQRPATADWLARGLAFGACGGLLALYALPTAHAAHPDSVQPPGLAALLGYALPCLVVGSAVAAAGFALLRALDRGGASRALLAASCGGVSANLLLQLHCPNTAPGHLILGHLGALLVIAGVVALRMRRDLTPTA
jgi:hypothetical protein